MSINKLVFDIETVGVDFDSLDETTRESLTRWIKRIVVGNRIQRSPELKSGLGFSPLTGEIVVIGVLIARKSRRGLFSSPGRRHKRIQQR